MAATVTFVDGTESISCRACGTLLDSALEAGVRITHICRGDGSCGTCLLNVAEGWENLTPMSPVEESREMSRPYRLACQTYARGDVVVSAVEID